jgi:hypothetical protein
MDLYKNAMQNLNVGTSGGNRSSTGTIIVIVLSIALLVGLVLYYFFKPKPDHVTVLGPYNLKGVSASAGGSSQETLFDAVQLNKNLGNNFTLSGFFYMDEVNAERIPIAGPAGDYRFKPLVYILGVGTVIVDPLHQKVRVSIQPLTDPTVRRVDAPVNIDIDNFLVARWNQLTVTLEGRSVDVYLNGVLVKSALLENVPRLKPVGVLLETIPDFSGQAGLFQAWPRRLTGSEVIRNYKRNVDLRGKPAIPDGSLDWSEVWNTLKDKLCKVGFCGFNYDTGPLMYVDYQFA